MQEPTSDEALMHAYARGEVAAFTLLYDRHERGLWRFIFRHTRNQAAADDVAQEVWCSVMDAAARYVPTAKFRTWLFTIAHHRVIDVARGARHHASLDEEHEGAASLYDSLAAESRLGPLRQIQTMEEGAALLRAVEQLPAAQKEAFLLQAEGEMSVEEIAAATGTSFETAKSRLRYARNALRELLAEFSDVAA
jgi:RNA polymerase sigma factor (sigma-70 family)